MSFTNYRANDLSKYRSSFANYGVDDFYGRAEKINPNNFYDLGVVSGTVEVDLSNHKYFKIELGNDVLISGSHSSKQLNLNDFYIELYNPSTFTVDWDTWFEWSSGTVPTLTSSGTYLLSFYETNIISYGVLSYTKCIGFLG